MTTTIVITAEAPLPEGMTLAEAIETQQSGLKGWVDEEMEGEIEDGLSLTASVVTVGEVVA